MDTTTVGVALAKNVVVDRAGFDAAMEAQRRMAKAASKFGADQRINGLPLTVGGNFNWNPAYDTRRTLEQSAYQGAKRVLDVYGLWRLSPSAGLRLTVSNLTPLDYVTGSSFSSGNQSESARTTARNWQNVQLRLELKI